ncbi:MAG: hypothetical protein SFV15_21375 [Polyangiaceae bacterium]|nr:hypothetical protein [Polyangiaceae bacterium]
MAPALAVEITGEAEPLLDATLTRRLIRLELGESELSEFVDADGKRLEPLLFFRIALAGETALVELWERGRLYGSRRVSLQGNQHLRARRISLTAAELGRRLREHAISLALAEADARTARLQRADAILAARRQFLPSFRTGVFGASLGEQTWLGGVRAELLIPLPDKLSVDLSGGWAHGRTSVASNPSTLNWWEVSLAPSYAWELGTDWQGSLGFRVAGVLAQVSRTQPSRNVEWSARAALEPNLALGVSPGFILGLRPELGWLLREVPVGDTKTSSKAALSGVWLGASLLGTFGQRR